MSNEIKMKRLKNKYKRYGGPAGESEKNREKCFALSISWSPWIHADHTTQMVLVYIVCVYV